jgi:hypothetical protein
LRGYIAFARATCNPDLTTEAAQRLASAYAEMRAMGMSRKVGARGWGVRVRGEDLDGVVQGAWWHAREICVNGLPLAQPSAHTTRRL